MTQAVKMSVGGSMPSGRRPGAGRRVESPLIKDARGFVARALSQKGVSAQAFPALLDRYRGGLNAYRDSLRKPGAVATTRVILEQNISLALQFYGADAARISRSTDQDLAMLYLLTEALENTLRMPRVSIPAGEVLLGSPDTDTVASHDEKPQVRVRLSAFEAARNLLSVGDVAFYNSESGGTPIEIPKFESFLKLNSNPDDPIAGLKWSEARKIAQWYGGDLPTEAQYGYVAKGRTGRDRYGTPLENAITWESWGERNQSTAPICAEADHSRENDFGVCDVAGNLWKWTLDQYDEERYHAIRPGELDPLLPFADVGNPVQRGGSWDHYSWDARAACRDSMAAEHRFHGTGVWIVWNFPRT